MALSVDPFTKLLLLHLAAQRFLNTTRPESAAFSAGTVGPRNLVLSLSSPVFVFYVTSARASFAVSELPPVLSWEQGSVAFSSFVMGLPDGALTCEDRSGPTLLHFTYQEECCQAFAVRAVSSGFLLGIPNGGIKSECFELAETEGYSGLIGPFTEVP